MTAERLSFSHQPQFLQLIWNKTQKKITTWKNPQGVTIFNLSPKCFRAVSRIFLSSKALGYKNSSDNALKTLSGAFRRILHVVQNAGHVQLGVSLDEKLEMLLSQFPHSRKICLFCQSLCSLNLRLANKKSTSESEVLCVLCF